MASNIVIQETVECGFLEESVYANLKSMRRLYQSQILTINIELPCVRVFLSRLGEAVSNS